MRKILSVIFIAALRMLAITWRIRIDNNFAPDQSVIIFWHGAMLPVWKFFANTNSTAVVSLSSDGEILASLLENWGYKLIRGSSSSGGRQTLAAMTESARASKVLVTPDGPRGPNGIIKAGAIVAAQRSQSPLICCKVQISNKISLNSWDHFAAPLPFAKINIIAKIIPDVSSMSVDDAMRRARVLLGEWP